MKLLEHLQHKYAMTRKGAKDLVKAVLMSALMDLVLMMPVALLYLLVSDLLGGGIRSIAFYAVGTIVSLAAIAGMEYTKYNAQFLSVYIESGKRRMTLAEKLRKLPLSYFGKKDLSDLTGTIMNDAAVIETGSSHWLPELYGSIISTTLVSLGLLLFDWRMALAAIWVVPVALADVFLSAKFQNHFSLRSNEARIALDDGIQETLEAFQDIKANNVENRQLEALDDKIRTVEKRAIGSELATALFVVTGQILLKVGIATVALAGAWLLGGGRLDLMVFFMFLLVASRLYDPLQASLINLGAANSLNVQCERMAGILEHPVQGGVHELSNKGYDIRFEDVRFAYETGGTPVLNGVSFAARQGEVTAVIGPSGSGKTTVSRLAARFWDIPSGRITVGGMDVSKVDPETLMSLYSIVFQDVILFNNSILENIRIGRKDATDEEVLAAARAAHVDVFAEHLTDGWNTLIGENGSELSGGERQRISIARAFLKDAPIILLDEATASLDVENETFIQESLSRLIRGKTVLVIAHRMRTVAGASKIVVLKDGKVQTEGTPQELAGRPGFYRDMLARNS